MESSVRPKTSVNSVMSTSPVRAMSGHSTEDVFRDGMIDLNQLNYILRNPELPKSRLKMKSILRQYNEEKRKAITLSRIQFNFNSSHSVNSLRNSLNANVLPPEEPNVDLDQLSDFEVKLSQLPQELLISILGETFAKYENEMNKQNERKTDDSVSQTNGVKKEVLSQNVTEFGQDLTQTVDQLKQRLKKLISEYESIEKAEKIASNELQIVSQELENKLSALRECIEFCERLKLKNVFINQKQNDLKTKKCELKAEIKEINEKLIELSISRNSKQTKGNSFVENNVVLETLTPKTETIDLTFDLTQNSNNVLNSTNLSETKQRRRKSKETDSTKGQQKKAKKSMNSKKSKNSCFESNGNNSRELSVNRNVESVPKNTSHTNEQNIELEENEVLMISDEEECNSKTNQNQSNSCSHNKNNTNWRQNYINIGFKPNHSNNLEHSLNARQTNSSPVPNTTPTSTVNTISRMSSLTLTPVSTQVQNLISKTSSVSTPTSSAPNAMSPSLSSTVDTVSKTCSVAPTTVSTSLAHNPNAISASLASNSLTTLPMFPNLFRAPKANLNTSFSPNPSYVSNNRNNGQNSWNRNYNPNRHNVTVYSNNNYENMFEVSHRTNTSCVDFVPSVYCLYATQTDVYVGLQSGYINKYKFLENGLQFSHQFPHLNEDINALYYSEKYNYLYCGTNGGLFAYFNNTSSDLSYDKIQLNPTLNANKPIPSHHWTVNCFESSATILYMGLRNGFIYRFGLMSNQMVNEFKCLEVPIIRLKLLNDSSDRIIVCGKNEISIRNSVNGSLLHTLDKSENHCFVSTELHLTSNNIIIFSNFKESYFHRFYIYDEKIRDITNEFDNKSFIRFVTINGNNIYLFTFSYILYCYDLKKGVIEWSVRIKVSTKPLCMSVNNNRVLFGMRCGKVVQIIPDTNSPIVCKSHECGHSFPRLSDIFEHFHDKHAQPFFRFCYSYNNIFTCPWIGCQMAIRLDRTSELVRMIVEHMKTHVV